MNLTTEQLKQIIKEELKNMRNRDDLLFIVKKIDIIMGVMKNYKGDSGVNRPGVEDNFKTYDFEKVKPLHKELGEIKQQISKKIKEEPITNRDYKISVGFKEELKNLYFLVIKIHKLTDYKGSGWIKNAEPLVGMIKWYFQSRN